MEKYTHLLIDADETLYDFEKTERLALEKLFDTYGIVLTEAIKTAYEDINKALWKEVELGTMSQLKLRTERFSRLFESLNIKADAEAFSDTYVKFLGEGTYLLEGAYELVSDLKARYVIGILTNGIKEVQTARIQGSKIAHLIDAVIISEDVGYSKPDERIFEFALNKLDFYDKSKILMIGDSLTSDIQGANRFGIDSCWINWKSEVARDHEPTYVAANLEEIRQLLL